MSVDIDSAIVIIKIPIFNYLSKYEFAQLSLVNKIIRTNLIPILFKDLKLNDKVLKRHYNYFNQKKYYDVERLSFKEKLGIFLRYGFNMELVFKELYIDPYIEENNDTLEFASRYWKSLSFDGLQGSCYFIFPIFNNFLNFKKLTLRWCEISFKTFFNLLAKLQALEILIMEDVNLILATSESHNYSTNLQFPKSLKELTYTLVHLEITDMPHVTPLEFILTWDTKVIPPCLDLNPQLLPNLKYLRYRDRKMGKGLTEGFLALNPNINIEYGSQFIVREENWGAFCGCCS